MNDDYEWRALGREVGRCFKNVYRHNMLGLYFLFGVVLFGTFGVWFPGIFPLLTTSPTPCIDWAGVWQNLSTSTIGLVGAIGIEFLLAQTGTLPLRAAGGLLGAIAVVAAQLGYLAVGTHQDVAGWFAISGIILAWVVWILAAGNNPRRFENQPDPHAALGDTVSAMPGSTAGYTTS